MYKRKLAIEEQKLGVGIKKRDKCIARENASSRSCRDGTSCAGPLNLSISHSNYPMFATRNSVQKYRSSIEYFLSFYVLRVIIEKDGYDP